MTARQLLYWTPRVLGILYALFITLFTFDAWDGASSFWEGLLGWLIHLMPVFAVVLALVVAWRHPLVGGLLFLFMAVIFTLLFTFDLTEDWIDFVLATSMIAGPLALIGVLFLMESRRKPQPAMS